MFVQELFVPIFNKNATHYKWLIDNVQSKLEKNSEKIDPPRT